jgi:O-antigen/teichoic acid export membrane protein
LKSQEVLVISSSAVQFDDKRPSISSRFVRATGLASSAGIIARILQLLLLFIVAKVLSRSDYGIFTIVASTVTVGSELGQVGQGAALQKFVPQYAVHCSQRVAGLVSTIVGTASVCLLIAAASLFFTSRVAARVLYGDIYLANYLRIAAVIFVASGIFNVFAGVLSGLQDFGKYSFAQLLRSAILFVLGALGAALFGLTGVLTAQTIAVILVALLVGQFGSSALRAAFGAGFTFQFDRGALKEILGFSIPAFLASILVLPACWLGVTRLSKLFGLQEVAQFGITFGVMQFVLLIPNMTSMTATSFLSESYARSDDTFGSLSNLNLRVAWGSALIIAVLLAFAAPQLLHVLFGEKYAGIQNVLQYMMLSGVAIAIC